jgi:hypothetical protein
MLMLTKKKGLDWKPPDQGIDNLPLAPLVCKTLQCARTALSSCIEIF